MATTTNYSWTTPDDTDLVKDGASAIRTLGSSADTTVKDLNPGTTAGDIDYYTSSTAKARVGIGTAGQILQVNSGATAPEWGAAPSGSSNTYIPTGRNAYVTSPVISLANKDAVYETTYYTPVYLPTSTLDRISIRTGTSFGGGATDVRLGIYENGTTNLPTAVLLDAGTVSASAISTNYEITISQAVNAGLYWLALNMQTNNASNNFVGLTTTNIVAPYTAWNETISATNATVKAYEQTGVSGAFATAGTLLVSTNAIRVWVRVA